MNELDQVACLTECLGTPPSELFTTSSVYEQHFRPTGEPLYCTYLDLDGTIKPYGEGIQGKRGLPGTRPIESILYKSRKPCFIDFVKRCLTWDSEIRLKASEALHHEWFSRQRPKKPKTHPTFLVSFRRTPSISRMRLSLSSGTYVTSSEIDESNHPLSQLGKQAVSSKDLDTITDSKFGITSEDLPSTSKLKDPVISGKKHDIISEPYASPSKISYVKSTISRSKLPVPTTKTTYLSESNTSSGSSPHAIPTTSSIYKSQVYPTTSSRTFDVSPTTSSRTFNLSPTTSMTKLPSICCLHRPSTSKTMAIKSPIISRSKLPVISTETHPTSSTQTFIVTSSTSKVNSPTRSISEDSKIPIISNVTHPTSSTKTFIVSSSSSKVHSPTRPISRDSKIPVCISKNVNPSTSRNIPATTHAKQCFPTPKHRLTTDTRPLPVTYVKRSPYATPIAYPKSSPYYKKLPPVKVIKHPTIPRPSQSTASSSKQPVVTDTNLTPRRSAKSITHTKRTPTSSTKRPVLICTKPRSLKTARSSRSLTRGKQLPVIPKTPLATDEKHPLTAELILPTITKPKPATHQKEVASCSSKLPVIDIKNPVATGSKVPKKQSEAKSLKLPPIHSKHKKPM